MARFILAADELHRLLSTLETNLNTQKTLESLTSEVEEATRQVSEKYIQHLNALDYASLLE